MKQFVKAPHRFLAGALPRVRGFGQRGTELPDSVRQVYLKAHPRAKEEEQQQHTQLSNYVRQVYLKAHPRAKEEEQQQHTQLPDSVSRMEGQATTAAISPTPETRIVTPSSGLSLEQSKQLKHEHIEIHDVVSSPIVPSVEPLQPSEVANALELFAGYSRCFALSELIDWLDADADRDKIRQTLMDDPRFVWLGQRIQSEDYFVPDRALFRWWNYLSLRLARAAQARLSQRQLGEAMSSLRQCGRWDAPPDQAIAFGQCFGFVGVASEPGYYVFPLAHVLSYLSILPARIASVLLERLGDIEQRDLVLKQPLEEYVREGLSKFDERMAEVVVSREGLFGEREMTLEQIGQRMRVTRERVRQIEAGFWKTIIHSRRESTRPFVVGFLCHVMQRQGHLILDSSPPEASHIRFAARCAGIPWVQIPHTDIVVLGSSREDFASMVSSKWLPEQIDRDNMVRLLGSQANICLMVEDLVAIVDTVKSSRWKRLNKAQKVYLALRHIGRPAHYSLVAEVYHSLFPDDAATERNIHALLSRCGSPDREQYGVVWIGARGTYALKEWGYERPSKGLFEAVTEIVNKRYEESGKPVPFVVITAEIGRYRQVVRQASLFFATYFNASLRRVSEDTFAPREPGDQAREEEVTQDELDKILREFEQKHREGEI